MDIKLDVTFLSFEYMAMIRNNRFVKKNIIICIFAR